MAMAAATANATHHERCRMPMSANGANAGLKNPNTLGQAQSVPAATNAALQMSLFPTIKAFCVRGQRRHRAINGHAHIAGRFRQTANATKTTGTPNHAGHGTTTKGTNSRIDGGG